LFRRGTGVLRPVVGQPRSWLMPVMNPVLIALCISASAHGLPPQTGVSQPTAPIAGVDAPAAPVRSLAGKAKQLDAVAGDGGPTGGDLKRNAVHITGVKAPPFKPVLNVRSIV
ncbi:MAG: hypothetical protein ABIO29_03750, partial [Sphingomicrobium sp.]